MDPLMAFGMQSLPNARLEGWLKLQGISCTCLNLSMSEKFTVEAQKLETQYLTPKE